MSKLLLNKTKPIARAEAPCPCGEVHANDYEGFPIAPEVPDLGTESTETSCTLYPTYDVG
jgi:hypothetical protein